MKTEYTIKELDRIVKYVHELDRLSASHGVRIDSAGDQYLDMDGKETAFNVRYDDEGDIFVSLVVPL